VDDLLEFLNARIGEDEAAAVQATPGPWEFEGDDPADDELYTVHDGAGGDLTGQTVAWTRHRQVANGQHIARHDPARVLRDVAFRRKLIGFALRNAASIDGEWGDCHDAADIAAGLCSGHGDAAARDILGLLAAIWCDHPDYRPEWEPDDRTARGV
jgi:Family of unknown function (DUF6221)